jgi:hypothetical protein
MAVTVAVQKSANTFAERICEELESRQEKEEQWQKWSELYSGQPRSQTKNYPWPDSSNLVVNLSAIYVDSIVARIMQSVFQIEPHWVVEPVSTDTETAKGMERFLDWSRQHVWDQYRAVKPMVLEMCKLGTGILYTGWRDRQYYRTIPGQKGPQTVGRVVGPYSQWIPRRDFLIPYGFNRINDQNDGPRAPWVACRQRFSKPDLLSMLDTGFFDLSESDYDKLINQPDDTAVDGLTGETVESSEPMWEIWQVWYAEDMDGDGFPEEHVLSLHIPTRIVARFRPNPYIKGIRPFVACPFVEIEGEFDGIGVPEMVEQYQEELTTIHNQRRDNAHIANTTVMAARRGSGITEQTKLFPGKIFLLQDPNDIRELRFGQNYIVSMQEEHVTMSMAERRVGISDMSMGRESSATGRAAATTTMALLQEGSRRFDLTIAELRRALGEQGNHVVEMWQTHGLPEMTQAGSPESVLGIELGQRVRQAIDQPEDILGMLTMRLNVATAAVNREVEKQSTLALFQLMTNYFTQLFQLGQLISSPQTPPEIKSLAGSMARAADVLIQRVLQAHQTYDLDSILIGETIGQMADMSAMQMARQQMMPQQQMPPEMAGMPPEEGMPPQGLGGPQ